MSNPSNGFVALPKFILQHPDLTPEAIVLYANLCHFDRGSGRGCFAKRETLSRFTNMSLHKIRNAIKVLEDNGIISVVRRRNSLTDVIKITPDCRPPTKEAQTEQKRARKSTTRQPVSKSRNTQEIKDFNTSSLRDNNIIQSNNTCPTDCPEEATTTATATSKDYSWQAFVEQVKTPRTGVEPKPAGTIGPEPNPIYQRAPEEPSEPQIEPKP